ncbi:MAG TPA: iron ABC transporter permease [Devosiaceae bacterium]|jgi:iron(III) transport system permease protein
MEAVVSGQFRSVTLVQSIAMRNTEAAGFFRGLGTRLGALPIYGLFALLIGLPLSTVLLQAVFPQLFALSGAGFVFSADPLIRTVSSPRALQSIVNSLELAVGVAFTTTALGGGFALLVGRCELPLRRILSSLPWLVFLTPSYLKALAWVLLMAPGGYLAQLGLLPPALGQGFFSLPGLVFVHTLSLFPVPAFIIGAALAGLGGEYEEAARLAGARPLKIWFRINGPLLLPAIALSLMAVFAEVLSDFGLASTIARMSSFGVLTYGIYVAASDYPVDFPMAGAQALLLLALVFLVVIADRLLRRRTGPRLISGRSKPAQRYVLGSWRWLALAAAILVATPSLLLPLAAIVIRALSRTLGNGLTPANLTFDNVVSALSIGTAASGAIVRSLIFAVLSACIASAVSIVLAARLDRGGAMARSTVMGLSLGAVAIPGIVLGFGYILVWNRLPGFRDWSFPEYGSASLLITGYVAAALPYCLIVIVTAIGQIAPNLSDAARLHGIGAGRRLMAITLPLVALSVLTAFLLTFVRTVFELPISQMLIPQDGPPAPTVIVNLFSHDRDGLASAIALVAMLATGVAGAILWWVFRAATARRTPHASTLTGRAP